MESKKYFLVQKINDFKKEIKQLIKLKDDRLRATGQGNEIYFWISTLHIFCHT